MDVIKEESSSLEPKDSPERPSSPHDCAICLEQLKDKSFTNSCLHMFCFHCLEAWSKVKAECPLCKQDFCSIIHNIRSMTDYDEYHVPPVENRVSVTPPFLSPTDIPDGYFSGAHDFFSNRRRFFSYRTTLMPNAFSIQRVRSSNLVIQPYVDNLELENNFSRVNSMQPSTSRCNRAEIYAKELETHPPSTGRYRECSPQFYRENETQLHRLARWLHRELLALSQIGVRFVLHEVQHMIMDILLLYNINSSIFHDIISQYLGVHTTRFIRELYHFATSPYEMDQYDRECVYLRRRNGSHLSFIVTVGRDDSEDVQVIPNSSLDQSVRYRVNTSDYSNSSGLHFLSRPTSSTFSYGDVPSTSTPNATNPVINLTDSDDDCVIIDDVTVPETIVLDDSDSDINNVAAHSCPETSTDPQDSFSNNCCPLDLSTSRITRSQVSQSVSDKFSGPLFESKVFCELEKTNSRAESEEKSIDITNARLKYRRRSHSDSSVLSTSNSSCESDFCYADKRNKRIRKSRLKRTAPKKFSSDEYSYESAVDSGQSDPDWEELRKKRKKRTKKSHVAKRDKKHGSKKRKKSADRKTRKKKVSATSCSIDCDMIENKSKKVAKCKPRSPRTCELVDSPRLGTKLCSVVKVVHRNADCDNLMDQPSTSSGFRGYENRSNFVNFGRNAYFSDSD